MIKFASLFLAFSFVLFTSLTASAQDVNNAIIIANGSTFERIERSYDIDNSTIIWHAMMDGNRLTAVLFTKNASNIWQSKKLDLSHFDVYSTKWVGYAKIEGNIVRFRIDKNKKLGFQYFMDKLVGGNFEKAVTPFHTEPIVGDEPLIEEVILTDRINLILRNSNSDGTISAKKIKSFDLEDLSLLSTDEIELDNSAKVHSTNAVSIHNTLGFLYFDDQSNFHVTLVKEGEPRNYVYSREKGKGVMHVDYPRISEGKLHITLLDDQINPTSTLLELDENKPDELTVLDQKSISWDEAFRDYPDKLNSGSGIMVSGMKRRTYELTNVLDEGETKFMVYVIAIPIVGASQNSAGEFSRSVWGVDRSDLLVVKITNNKVEWMQTVRRAYRTVNKKEEMHVPVASLDGNELILMNRESSQFFDAGGKYISGLEQGRIPNLVDSRVVIDTNSGNILSNKLAE